jgi:hypothetical protein
MHLLIDETGIKVASDGEWRTASMVGLSDGSGVRSTSASSHAVP